MKDEVAAEMEKLEDQQQIQPGSEGERAKAKKRVGSGMGEEGKVGLLLLETKATAIVVMKCGTDGLVEKKMECEWRRNQS